MSPSRRSGTGVVRMYYVSFSGVVWIHLLSFSGVVRIYFFVVFRWVVEAKEGSRCEGVER